MMILRIENKSAIVQPPKKEDKSQVQILTNRSDKSELTEMKDLLKQMNGRIKK